MEMQDGFDMPRPHVAAQRRFMVDVVRRCWLLVLSTVWHSRFARNWSLLVFSTVACQPLGMLANIRIARALAPGGYGQFNLVQSVAGLASVFAGLGLRNVVVRECARHPGNSARIFYTSAILRLVALFAVGSGILLYSRVDAHWLSLNFAA